MQLASLRLKQDLVHFCKTGSTGDQSKPINLFTIEKLFQNQQESALANSNEHGQKIGREREQQSKGQDF